MRYEIPHFRRIHTFKTLSLPVFMSSTFDTIPHIYLLPISRLGRATVPKLLTRDYERKMRLSSTKSHVWVLLHRQMSRSAVCTHLWLRRQQMEQYYPAGRSFGRPLATDARPGTHAASDADTTVVFNSAPRPGCKNTVICY